MSRVAVLLFSDLLLAAVFLWTVPVSAQLRFHPSVGSRNGEATAAVVKALRIRHEKEGVAVEISLTQSVEPTVTRLDGPPRLVIDLPNTLVSLSKKRYAFSGGQISAVRLDQYQNAPPVGRAVIDMLAPARYSWTSTKNTLTIHLHPSDILEPEAVSAEGGAAAAVPATSAASGSLLLAGGRIGRDSSVTAGSDAAILRLAHGGEVRVCPGTTVSVTSSKSGQDLMFGMSTGALEEHYTLNASEDSILTPDFRLLLAGPGEFDYAMSVDNRGNTCVRALPGNTAPVMVSELMGDGTYQVKPDEQVVFYGGRLAVHDSNVPLNCGCPPPSPAVMRASGSAPAMTGAKMAESVQLAEANPRPNSMMRAPDGNNPNPLPAEVEVSIAHPESAPLPKSGANDVHVQVDAPFVFRGRPSAIPPAPIPEVARLPVLQTEAPLPVVVAIPPPARPAKKTPHGFFSRVKHFFGAIFH